MLKILTGESLEKRVGISGTQAERRGIFDHLIVLLPNQLPADRPGEDRREVGVVVRAARDGSIELLRGDSFESGHQVKAQQVAHGKPNGALPVTIDVLAIDLHLRAMAQ